MDEETTITVKKAVRDELRRFKAEDGQTYDEAIITLLIANGWIDSEEEIHKEKDK